MINEPLTEPELDRSKWEAQIMKKHPDVLELRERLRCFSGNAGNGSTNLSLSCSSTKKPLSVIPEDDDDGKNTDTAAFCSNTSTEAAAAAAAALLPHYSFGRDYRNVAKTEVPSVLPEHVVIQLIVQYLHEEGFHQARDALLTETKASGGGCCDYRGPSEPLFQGALVPLLHVGIKDMKDIEGKCSGGGDDGDGGGGVEEENSDSEDQEVEAYEYYVHNGLWDDDDEDENNDLQMINVWDEEPLENVNIRWVFGEDSLESSPNYSNPDSTTTENDTEPKEEEGPQEEEDQKYKQIMGATLNQIIRCATDPENPDLNIFRKVLFATYHSFTSPEKLLLKFIERYRVPTTHEHEDEEASLALICIKTWVTLYPQDFDESLLKLLNIFIDSLAPKEARILRTAVAKVDNNLVVKADLPPPIPKVPKKIFSPYLTLEDVDEEEIARQLCLIDFSSFSKLQRSELFSCNWVKEESSSSKMMAIHVHQMMVMFNNISNWVAKTLDTAPNAKKRIRSQMKFYKIADHLKSLNNFHSLFAVYCGLAAGNADGSGSASGSSSNLGKVGPGIGIRERRNSFDSQNLALLAILFSPEKNYSRYRMAYNNASPPKIPFIGLCLRDFAIMDKILPDKLLANSATGTNNNSKTVPDSLPLNSNKRKLLVNFQKRVFMAKQIENVFRFHNITYNFLMVNQIKNLLMKSGSF